MPTKNGAKEDSVTMKSKKLTKVLALSFLGIFALTGCDEVYATPGDYEAQLVDVTKTGYGDDLHNNIASVVYDAIHDAGVGQDVLDQILYLYSVSAFGPYDGKVVINGKKVSEMENTITLQQAATDPTKIDDFVRSHKAYWDKGTNGRTDANTPAAISDSEKERVITRYNSVNERIAEEMYNKINNDSYKDMHVFSELTFVKSLRASLENVENPADHTAGDFHKAQILPAYEPKDVFGNADKGFDGYLHRSYYDSDSNNYIVDKIVPTIYRQLLAEQYVLDETYNTLGRSYARSVNIIKFNYNENNPSAAYSLAKELATEINDPNYKDHYIYNELKDDLLERFKEYSKAQIGVVGAVGTEAAILNGAKIYKHVYSAYEESLDLDDDLSTYFPGTDYGDTAKKYTKMIDIKTNGVSSDLESTFSNNGQYSFYVGLQQEKMTLEEKDYTTNGWYIKNGGLTDLPDSIRSRLFNIGVATGVKEDTTEKAAYERTYNTTKNEWEAPSVENSYVCRINGHNFLKTASRVKGDPIDLDILHYDTSSKCYYIVEILDAVSSSKLSINGSHNYETTVGAKEMQRIVDEVCKIVGKSESYSTLATKKCLKEMAIEYHDESVYDYFKTNYPELFDSDAEAADTSSEDTSDSTTPASSETPASDSSAE